MFDCPICLDECKDGVSLYTCDHLMCVACTHKSFDVCVCATCPSCRASSKHEWRIKINGEDGTLWMVSDEGDVLTLRDNACVTSHMGCLPTADTLYDLIAALNLCTLTRLSRTGYVLYSSNEVRPCLPTLDLFTSVPVATTSQPIGKTYRNHYEPAHVLQTPDDCTFDPTSFIRHNHFPIAWADVTDDSDDLPGLRTDDSDDYSDSDELSMPEQLLLLQTVVSRQMQLVLDRVWIE
jgi:hypothetical protein